ncbi:MAG: hypothetical protein ACYDDI_15605 [Candidatus Acidiferrales bacterium]
MPNYNAQNPPNSIYPGDVVFAFNAEAPAAGQASQQFALPSYSGFPENSRTIRWQTIFGTAPTSVSVVLQTATIDSDAQYATVDTSTATLRAKLEQSPACAEISFAQRSAPSRAAPASRFNCSDNAMQGSAANYFRRTCAEKSTKCQNKNKRSAERASANRNRAKANR